MANLVPINGPVTSVWVWREEGLIPMPVGSRTIDPTIAFDPATGHFLAACLDNSSSDTGQILVADYLGAEPGSNFSTWRPATNWPQPGNGMDIPRIVAGTANEFYILHEHEPDGQGRGFAYARSIDGGATWTFGPVTVGGVRVLSSLTNFLAFPAVAGGGPLYVAYVHAGVGPTAQTVRFLEGTDSGPGVSFQDLLVAPGSPLEVQINRRNVSPLLPGAYNEIETLPELAADPTNPDRLYLVYHDTATDAPSDTNVDVYLRILTRAGAFWQASAPIQVNDPDPPETDVDQFLPTITVDSAGRTHVIFYDDRRFVQDDAQTNPPPKFDVFYAVSFDGGLHWDALDAELFARPTAPALDYSHELFVGFEPGEYIGISWYGDEVWTSYAGSKATPNDPDDDESVIWSSRIDWSAP